MSTLVPPDSRAEDALRAIAKVLRDERDAARAASNYGAADQLHDAAIYVGHAAQIATVSK